MNRSTFLHAVVIMATSLYSAYNPGPNILLAMIVGFSFLVIVQMPAVIKYDVGVPKIIAFTGPLIFSIIPGFASFVAINKMLEYEVNVYWIGVFCLGYVLAHTVAVYYLFFIKVLKPAITQRGLS